MAVQEVYVAVVVSEFGITISVNPWSVYVPLGDTVALIPVTSNIQTLTIQNCPGKPSFLKDAFGKSKLTAKGKLRAKFDKKSKLGKKLLAKLERGAKTKKVHKPYQIDLTFEYPAGNTRSATIDPDMVMDT